MKIHKFKQGSPEWLAFRVRKVTGTSLKRVKGSKHLEYSDIIASERVTGKRKERDFKSQSMDDGHVLEPYAREAYVEMFNGQNVTVDQVGFIQSDQFPDFGMSPDGLIYYNGNLVGVLEIKCPEPQTHIGYIRENTIPTEYRDQIYSAFVIGDEIQYVDFISYCPFVKQYPVFFKRVHRKECEIEIAQYRGALIVFFEDVDRIEQVVQKGNGFIPSNIENAIWTASEPEDLIFETEDKPYKPDELETPPPPDLFL